MPLRLRTNLDRPTYPAIAVPIGPAISPVTGTRRGRGRGEKSADHPAEDRAREEAMVMVVMMVVMVMILNTFQLRGRAGLQARGFVSVESGNGIRNWLQQLRIARRLRDGSRLRLRCLHRADGC